MIGMTLSARFGWSPWAIQEAVAAAAMLDDGVNRVREALGRIERDPSIGDRLERPSGCRWYSLADVGLAYGVCRDDRARLVLLAAGWAEAATFDRASEACGAPDAPLSAHVQRLAPRPRTVATAEVPLQHPLLASVRRRWEQDTSAERDDAAFGGGKPFTVFGDGSELAVRALYAGGIRLLVAAERDQGRRLRDFAQSLALEGRTRV